MKNKIAIDNISQLASIIEETHKYFATHVQKQVNVALTLRNWLIGYYLVEYEQNGTDRAEYGKALINNLSVQLKQRNLKGFSEIALRLNRSFYLAYPQIQQTLSVEFATPDSQMLKIQQTLSVELQTTHQKPENLSLLDPVLLVNRLSFSHFIELLKTDNPVARSFYEVESIKNEWTVRQLQRAMNSMLFERTGLNKHLESKPDKIIKQEKASAKDLFRNPLILEFLGLEEKSEFNESDLEQAIIDQLQKFLLELGRGFCFEARQKRITFDNTHYRIDLVFYHRILKCHVLIDLKIGEFTHADSGQMNVYLNYYKNHETNPGDNPPIGIIMCASNNENLVKYATSGLSHQVFVSKYMINLPKEEELKKIIFEEQVKLNKGQE
jgi:predicted nuclease of restriction endonuclease-like (RecB) superfamily